MKRASAFFALFTVAGILVAERAAASPSAKLVYVRGPGAEACPAEGELRRAVAQRLGYDPFFPAAPKTVVAEVTRAERGYRGVVQIVGDDGNLRGRRELGTKGDDCTEVVTAMALAVSLALDDLDDAPPAKPGAQETAPAVRDGEPDGPGRDARDGPTPEPEPKRPPDERPTRGAGDSADSGAGAGAKPGSRPLVFSLAVGPTVSFGTAPSAAPGAGVAASLRSGAFAVRADVRAELPTSAVITVPVSPSRPPGSVSTNAVLGELTGCVHGAIPFACAGGAVGWIWSRTENLTAPKSDSTSAVFAVLRFGADVAIGERFYIEPSIEGAANLTRPRVVVDEITVYQQGTLAISGGVLVGARFQ